MSLRHRIAHWFGWNACRNDTARINGEAWHFVWCVTCGQTVMAFRASEMRGTAMDPDAVLKARNRD